MYFCWLYPHSRWVSDADKNLKPCVVDSLQFSLRFGIKLPLTLDRQPHFCLLAISLGAISLLNYNRPYSTSTQDYHSVNVLWWESELFNVFHALLWLYLKDIDNYMQNYCQYSIISPWTQWETGFLFSTSLFSSFCCKSQTTWSNISIETRQKLPLKKRSFVSAGPVQNCSGGL